MPCPPFSRRSEGFTLVEILVVLAIIGIATGATVIAIGRDRSRATPAAEANQLAQRLRLAADETMVSDRPLALDWDAHGYRFVTWDAGQRRWAGAAPGLLGRRRDLPGRMALSGAPRAPVPIDAGSADMLALTLQLADGGAATVRFDGADASVAAVQR